MAFDKKGLTMVATGAAVGSAPGNVRNLYFYVTNDADTVVETNGYFDSLSTLTPMAVDLLVGDVIIASLDVDGTPEVKMYVVSVGGADVTVVPMPIA